jgi:hypothetical protein
MLLAPATLTPWGRRRQWQTHGPHLVIGDVPPFERIDVGSEFITWARKIASFPQLFVDDSMYWIPHVKVED